METEAFSELFPLFNSAEPETLEWLLTVAVEQEYSIGEVVLEEDAWGNAVYFVIAGWLKFRRLLGEQSVAQVILGQGDFFGEMAILDEAPRSTDVVTLSAATLLSIPAQRFIQTLFKDPQLHHRLLQITVRKLRETQARFQLIHHPASVKLAYTLVFLAEHYGQLSEKGKDIFDVPLQDLADVSDISAEDAARVIERFEGRGWLAIDPDQQLISLINFKQLAHLVEHL